MTSITPLPEPENHDARLLVAVTRLEAKLDVAIANQSATLKAHGDDLADHETRIRKLEVAPTIPADLEARVRAVEAKPTVSPRALGAVVTSVIGLMLAAIPFLDRLYS